MQLQAAVDVGVHPVILNGKAGSQPFAEKLGEAFRAAGVEADVMSLEPGEDARALAQRALKRRPGVIVAAGGDGTIGAVADVVRGSGTALGVLPAGTFNHFAKDLGIPLDLAEAARVVARGKRARIDLGEVNGRVFINNASLGLYPGVVRERERQRRRLRRSKRAAMLWATLAALHRPPQLDLLLELDGREQRCAAPFVFIGNNEYAVEGFDIGTRARLDAGKLSVYTTRRCGSAGLIKLALHAVFGRLRQADDFMHTTVRSLRIESRRPQLLLATDGELRLAQTPLEFRVLPGALEVIVP